MDVNGNAFPSPHFRKDPTSRSFPWNWTHHPICPQETEVCCAWRRRLFRLPRRHLDTSKSARSTKGQREDKRRTQGWPARPENNSNKRRRTRGEQEGRKREDTELAGAARGHSIQKKDKTRTLSGRRVQGTASQCGQLFSSQEIFLRGNPTSKVFGENKTTRNYSLLGQLDSPSFFKAGMCSQAYPIARAQRVHVRRPLSSYTFTELELPQEVMPDAVTVSLELWLQGQAAKRGE